LIHLGKAPVLNVSFRVCHQSHHSDTLCPSKTRRYVVLAPPCDSPTPELDQLLSCPTPPAVPFLLQRPHVTPPGLFFYPPLRLVVVNMSFWIFVLRPGKTLYFVVLTPPSPTPPQMDSVVHPVEFFVSHLCFWTRHFPTCSRDSSPLNLFFLLSFFRT